MSDLDTPLTPPGPDDLAFEYVLGTLSANEREAVERRLRDDRALARAVAFWERHLALLLVAEAEVPPPAAMRSRLLARLFPDRAPDPAVLRRLSWWRGVALAAGVAVVALSVTLIARVEQAGRPVAPVTRVAAPEAPAPIRQAAFKPSYCAFFRHDDDMVWVLWGDPQHGRMRAVVPSQQVAYDDAARSMELWMLPEDGGAPRSLGLLPASGMVELDMPADLVARARGLAVSDEPVGGSPTGLPTGPVVYQARWWSLG